MRRPLDPLGSLRSEAHTMARTRISLSCSAQAPYLAGWVCALRPGSGHKPAGNYGYPRVTRRVRRPPGVGPSSQNRPRMRALRYGPRGGSVGRRHH